jgi:GNAT superfamily N-acetyltransferase
MAESRTVAVDRVISQSLGAVEKSTQPSLNLRCVNDLVIRQTRFGAPVAQQLVTAAQADLAERYGSGDENPVEAVEFDPPEGAFLVAYRGDQPVACGGWRTLSHYSDGDERDDVAEIKRMYSIPEVRGQGVAQAVLVALENSAREHGMRRVVLETGQRNPEAVGMYAKYGYERITNYGYYKNEPDCLSFGRDL